MADSTRTDAARVRTLIKFLAMYANKHFKSQIDISGVIDAMRIKPRGADSYKATKEIAENFITDKIETLLELGDDIMDAQKDIDSEHRRNHSLKNLTAKEKKVAEEAIRNLKK